ncbi:MAG: ShlB/FhaC/HecB family hemolysin secretion/activation protein [Chlamydiia bacterium]|nr:ShlB/FhaC/HecB family hemolysin secretion/activation protein [Chlamydiia bacterium]
MDRLLSIAGVLASFLAQGYCTEGEVALNENLYPKNPNQLEAPEAPPYIADEDKIVIPCTKGIVIIGEPSQFHSGGVSGVEGIRFIDLKVPGNQEEFRSRLYFKYINKPLTFGDIRKLKQEIVTYYRSEHRPVMYVKIPEQKISDGTLQVIAVESLVGSISYSGNKHFKTEQLSRFVQLKEGGPIDDNRLAVDLDLMNRNPFRQTNVIFTPSDSALGVTDVEFVTNDRRPYRFYTGGENTGFEVTGYNRWFFGVNIGNLFRQDQVLDYQFTSGNSAHKFMAHTFRWVIPFPWRHNVELFGGYSRVHARILGTEIDTEGESEQISCRYEIPLPMRKSLVHEFSFGFDFKRTNNNIIPAGQPVIGSAANISQFIVGYNLGWETSWTRVSFTVEVFGSPGQLLPDESSEDYGSLRPGAKADYIYTRLAFVPIFHLPYGFSIVWKVRGQLASGSLLQSEQFGLGGFNSVRGYVDRTMSVDNAFLTNLELRSPSVSLSKLFLRKKRGDAFQLLGFVDWGFGRNYDTVSLTNNSNHLIGIGPGARYVIDPYLTARLDVGFQMHSLRFFDPFHYRAHFNFVLSY